jgi:predicted MPP superfamily phosphohydrolase
MHSRSHTRLVIALALFVGAIGAPAAQDVSLPNQPDSLKFAIIGDSGTGSSSQYKVAEMLVAARAKFPYEFILMLGDNLYSGSGPKDYKKKFEEPYKALLDSGLKFYAALGNHDNTDERNYKPFNMGGQRYYTFKPKNGVRIFALDSNYMDQPQLQWLEKELTASGSDWKIVFFHHPLYSSGMHGSDIQLREQLEPLFLKYGVDVVFSGHEHFYERIKPQKGIYYFTSGGAAKLREGDVNKTDLTAKSFDTGYHFMLIELTKDALHFQAISDQGKTVDSGTLQRVSDQDKKKLATS